MDEERLNNWRIKILEEVITSIDKLVIEKPNSTEFLRKKRIKLKALLNKYKNS